MAHPPSPSRFLARLLLAVNLGAAAVSVASASTPESPQWRGADGQGHAIANRLPITWNEHTNVAWKTEVPGRGWSSPVLDATHIWLTTALETTARPEDAQRRLKDNTGDQPLTLLDSVEFLAVGIERASGRLTHRIPLLAQREPQWVHTLNSYASPTPVLAEGHLYCHFGTFGTACVDTRTGSLLWTNTSLRIMHENGPGSSPVVWKNLLVVHFDGSDQQFVAAFDRATGAVVWKTPRSGRLHENPQLRKSYATPNLTTLAGRPVLLSEGADWLYAYDPDTGSELWKLNLEHLGFSQSARAVLGHGHLFLSTGYMRPELLAVRLQGPDAPKVSWRYAKGVPTMPSPLLVGNELYFVSDSGGMLTCLNALTGEEHYRERLGGNHSASLLFADGHLLIPSREAVTSVVAPGPTFRLVARNELPGQIMATPAAVGDSLFIRTDTALYRVTQAPR